MPFKSGTDKVEESAIEKILDGVSDPVIAAVNGTIVFANNPAYSAFSRDSGRSIVSGNISGLLKPEYAHMIGDLSESSEGIVVKDISDVVWSVRKKVTAIAGQETNIFQFRRIPVNEQLLASLPSSNPNGIVGIKLPDRGGGKAELYLNDVTKKRFPKFEQSHLPEILEIIDFLMKSDQESYVRTIRDKSENGIRFYEQRIVYLPREKMAMVYFSDITDLVYMTELPKHNPNPVIKIKLNMPGGGKGLKYCNREGRMHFPELDVSGFSGRVLHSFEDGVAFADFRSDIESCEIFNGLDDVIDLLRKTDKRVYVREVEVTHYERPPRFYEQKIVFDAENDYVILFLTDITERVKLVQRMKDVHEVLEDKAIRDPLTKLYNRRYLGDALKNYVSEAERSGNYLGVIMIDIDFFKTINDKFGHPAGDTVLCNVARILSESIRKNDIICRYGGDEFTVLLPGTDPHGTKIAAEKLRLAVEEQSKAVYDGIQFPRITISAGCISFLPQESDERDPTENSTFLLSVADAALRTAKETRNRVYMPHISQGIKT
ncbi:GGDEF domain-containing protein [Patescibacteria group bacterium]|nr:GGDEF domain-containing protein [Patescibacteria group bacterium]